MKFKEPGGSGEQVPAVGLCGGINCRIRHLRKVCLYGYRYLSSPFNYSRWVLPVLVSKGHLSRLSALSVTACKLCREGAWPACKMDGELCAELGGGSGTAPAPSERLWSRHRHGMGEKRLSGQWNPSWGHLGWHPTFSFSTPSWWLLRSLGANVATKMINLCLALLP